MTKLGFVLVHYHTPRLLAQAVAAIRRELDSLGETGDVVVVDNGSDEGERRALAALPVRLVVTAGNPGYAAALNLGVSHSEGDILFLMNPDVMLEPGCAAALVAALDDGAAVAGPRFYWDHDRTFLLPPTEKRSRLAELTARLASRGPRWTGYARSRWRRHARWHWLATEPIDTVSLSGALLAVRREAFDAVGPFDEGFRLYFEENDWLIRLRKQGLASMHVPAAEAIHLYNRSATQQSSASRWAVESRLRFEERHFGVWFSKFLVRLDGEFQPAPIAPCQRSAGLPSISIPEAAWESGGSLWIEVSPLARGFPAAAARIAARIEEWDFPPDVWSHLASGTYYLCVCTDSGEELLRASFHRPN